MPRAFIFLAAFVGILLAAALLLRELTESASPNLAPVHARSFVQQVAGRFRLTFRKNPPRVSPSLLKQQLAQELNEGIGPRERAAAGAEQTQRSDVAAASLAPAEDLVVFTNTRAYKGSPERLVVDLIAEPTVAMNANRVLLTWNWGAAASEDGGRTFPLFLNPFSLRRKPEKPDSREPLPFCCDQLAYHVPKTETRPQLWFWVVQSKQNAPGDQVIRLQWLVGDKQFDVNTFLRLDFSAQSLFGLPAGYWLDQPRIGATEGHLFIAVNVYDPDEHYYASYVIRLSNDALALGRPRAREVVQVGSRQSGLAGFVSFTRGATDTMYFAGQLSPSKLRVWKWPDDSGDPDGRTDVIHSAYARQGSYDCRRTGTPSAANWCGRKANDARVLAGWIANGLVGFAWNAPANPTAGFRYPYVQVVQLNEDTLTLRDEPSIVLKRAGVNYAALVPNGRGEVGGVVLIGGGNRYETCAAVARDPQADSGSIGWDMTVIDASDRDSISPSGDYLGATTTSADGNVWAVACMTLHGASREGRDDAEVRFATFGRAQDRAEYYPQR
jgi:hypothetical protein